MSTEWAVPLDRVYLLNPGQTLDVGDRTLKAFRPPLFDNPVTTGFLDSKSGALISSDCFGGPMASAEVATCEDVRAAGDNVRDAQMLWASIDSPWVLMADPAKYRPTVEAVRRMDPSGIFSTHLPPAVGLTHELCDAALAALDAPTFIGPYQAALEALLATFEPMPA